MEDQNEKHSMSIAMMNTLSHQNIFGNNDNKLAGLLFKEMDQDLTVFLSRLQKTLEIEREYREEILEYIYTVAYPDAKVLKMGKNEIL